MGNSNIEIVAASAGGTFRFAVNTISFGEYRRGFQPGRRISGCSKII